MKFYFWANLLFLGLLWQCFSINSSMIVWLTASKYNFGEIPQYKEQSHRFYFKNITRESLSIDNVRTTCGCTASEWEKKAILPDSIGSINIIYDAKQTGAFKKKVKVFFANQRLPEILFVEGLVQ